MRLSTKTLASLLLVTTVAAAIPGASQMGKRKGRKSESRFDRIMQRHDRKGDLRASVLGLDPAEFRALTRSTPFEAIIKQAGFSGRRSFRLALMGKIRSELLLRGWTRQKIERFVISRASRVN